MDLSVAIDLCRQFEGFRPAPYLCPAGIPTIGYGSTFYPDGRAVTMEDEAISQEGAEILLDEELRKRSVPAVIKYCPNLLRIGTTSGNWNKLNAIADFVYNLGAGRLQTSTLRRKINEEDWDAAANELRRWTRGGGRILPGLVKRRDAEAALLLS